MVNVVFKTIGLEGRKMRQVCEVYFAAEVHFEVKLMAERRGDGAQKGADPLVRGSAELSFAALMTSAESFVF
jgi:hypothetical protein